MFTLCSTLVPFLNLSCYNPSIQVRTWLFHQVTLSPHPKRSSFLSEPSFIYLMNSVCFPFLKHEPVGALNNRRFRFGGGVPLSEKPSTTPMRTVSVEYRLTVRQAAYVNNMSHSHILNRSISNSILGKIRVQGASTAVKMAPGYI